MDEEEASEGRLDCEDEDDEALLQAGESLEPESPRADLKNNGNLIIPGLMSSVSGSLHVHTHHLGNNDA